MKNGWMIRAGNSGRYFDDFEDSKCVAIGWNDLGDLRQYTTAAALREAYIHHFGNDKSGRTANAVAMIRKFRDDIQQGDLLVTYSQEYREYLVGEDQGQYDMQTYNPLWADLPRFLFYCCSIFIWKRRHKH